MANPGTGTREEGLAMRRIVFATLILIAWAGTAWAGMEEGLAAYHRGDHGAALGQWGPLAQQGNAKAQYNIGLLYTNGQGVAADQAEAFTWYRKAAEQGLAQAEFAVGVIYATGRGVAQDHGAAAQ
jgi:TPR repeat protein